MSRQDLRVKSQISNYLISFENVCIGVFRGDDCIKSGVCFTKLVLFFWIAGVDHIGFHTGIRIIVVIILVVILAGF